MYIRLAVLFVLLPCLLRNIRCKPNSEMEAHLNGLFCPVFTPMDESGALNVSIIPEYAKYIKNSGLDGVVVAGIGGEGINLGVREKKKLIDAWVIAGKPLGLKIIAQVGGIPEPDIIELANYATTVRVDGILTLPPLSLQPLSPELFARVIEHLAKVTKTLPIIYDHEIFGGAGHGYISEYFQKASETVPQFKGIKTSIRDAIFIAATTKIRKDQNLFILDHTAVASGTLLGYDSFITPALSLFPEIIKGIIVSTKAGDLSKARKNQEKINKLIVFIKSQGNDHISPLKVAFQIISGINIGPTRFPLTPVSRKGVREIKNILKEMDIKIDKDR